MTFSLFDVVSLVQDLPEEGLHSGMIGAVIEVLKDIGRELGLKVLFSLLSTMHWTKIGATQRPEWFRWMYPPEHASSREWPRRNVV